MHRPADRDARPTQKWREAIAARAWDRVVQNDEAFVMSPGATAGCRRTAEYAQELLVSLKLDDGQIDGTHPDLTADDKRAIQDLVRRKAAAFWLAGTPTTVIRHVYHDTVPTGPPVRVPPHRLSPEDQSFTEEQIAAEVQRGQLVRGTSPWGSPAFPTKDVEPAHKQLRKRRLVVDYRAVNARTLRAQYTTRRADDMKREVAGSVYMTFLDACEG